MPLIRIDVLNTWNTFTMEYPEYKGYYIISDVAGGIEFLSYKKYGFEKMSFYPENLRRAIDELLNEHPRMARDFINFVLNDYVHLGILLD